MNPNATYTKRNVVGEWAVHVFENNGQQVHIECSKEEYGDLSKKGASMPKIGKMKWLYSFVSDKFDTHNGILNDGDYVEYDTYILANVGGRMPSLPKGSIVDGKMSEEALSKIQ